MGILSKLAKTAAKSKNKVTNSKSKSKATPKPKAETFESEIKALKNKAMTDSARQAEALRIAKKYGRPVTIGGKTFAPKNKTPMRKGGVVKKKK